MCMPCPWGGGPRGAAPRECGCGGEGTAAAEVRTCLAQHDGPNWCVCHRACAAQAYKLVITSDGLPAPTWHHQPHYATTSIACRGGMPVACSAVLTTAPQGLIRCRAGGSGEYPGGWRLSLMGASSAMKASLPFSTCIFDPYQS